MISTAIPVANGQPKRKRVTTACDRCHRNGARCIPGAYLDTCAPCQALEIKCTFDRPRKRRGPRPIAAREDNSSSEPPAVAGPSSRASNSGSRVKTLASSTAKPTGDWQYRCAVEHEVIAGLAEVFHLTAYPIHPYFHWPTFSAQISDRLYTTKQSFYAVVMAVCAVAAGRVRDCRNMMDLLPASVRRTRYPPSIFYKACLEVLPVNLAQIEEYDYLKTTAILQMAASQDGDVRSKLTHYGNYLTIAANMHFHDEDRWPKGLTCPEIQERRRLFWSAYQLDIHCALSFGGIPRQRESQANVRFPDLVYDDTDIQKDFIQIRPNSISFLQGFVFTVHIWRIIEHLLDRSQRRASEYADPLANMFNVATPSLEVILEKVVTMYDQVPAVFKFAEPMTGEPEHDRMGYTALNMLLAVQTAKMILAVCADQNILDRCQIAGELLDGLSAIPSSYVQLGGHNLLYVLAGVGTLLATVVQSHLTHWTYIQVRSVLLALADVLSSLEDSVTIKPGTAANLRSQVSRIDEAWRAPPSQTNVPISNTQPMKESPTTGTDGATNGPVNLDMPNFNLPTGPYPFDEGSTGTLTDPTALLPSLAQLLEQLGQTEMPADQGDPSNTIGVGSSNHLGMEHDFDWLRESRMNSPIRFFDPSGTN